MTDEITLDAPETRIERFLAAAAGVEGITLDEPETRIERYLYKIAQGGGGSGGGAVVHAVVSGSTATLDKTWQEILDGDYTAITFAPDSSIKSFLQISQVAHEGTYYVSARYGETTLEFDTDSASGYPSATME